MNESGINNTNIDPKDKYKGLHLVPAIEQPNGVKKVVINRDDHKENKGLSRVPLCIEYSAGVPEDVLHWFTIVVKKHSLTAKIMREPSLIERIDFVPKLKTVIDAISKGEIRPSAYGKVQDDLIKNVTRYSSAQMIDFKQMLEAKYVGKTKTEVPKELGGEA